MSMAGLHHRAQAHGEISKRIGLTWRLLLN
jgi:hypothetical protein